MKIYLSILVVTISAIFITQKLPKGFVYLSAIDTSIISDLRYFSNHNFIGKPIDGYHNNCVIVTKETANALKNAQQDLLKQGYSLKIFDAYRPQEAVNHFVRWAKVLHDTLMKKEFYPNIAKKDLFTLGFIASKSGHTRGSTVDLTIVNNSTNKELDMGSTYDFFGVESHPFYTAITKKQQENRLLLRTTMLKYNFKPYKNEWWHFTLRNEPFPKTYFNFPVQ